MSSIPQPSLIMEFETNHDGQLFVDSKFTPASSPDKRSSPSPPHTQTSAHRESAARWRKKSKGLRRTSSWKTAAQVEQAVPRSLPEIVDNPSNWIIPPEPVRHLAPQFQPTAAQVYPLHPHQPVLSVHEPPHGLSAAQAGRSTQAAEQSQPWLHATQQDQEYQQAEEAIPQLDGSPMLGDFAG